MIVEPASAKINLALHVTGRRDDGYHMLESVVAFADFGDHVRAEAAAYDRFQVVGPFAPALASESDNLVLEARAAFDVQLAETGGKRTPVAITLDKQLPIASGIGGGSADAAATLRSLNRIANRPLTGEILSGLALGLGADVPMCLASRAAIVSGIGERIVPLQDFRPLPAVLINPAVAVATPAVFKALTNRSNPPLPIFDAEAAAGPGFPESLAACRNDLEVPAIAVAPIIADVLDGLRKQPGCRLARMSGSGATCFGLFSSDETARQAERNLKATQPAWWARACRLGGGPT
ncbi:MAG: 4-(cytidine 5'-diphospho)-2-C-methyl-D-erythritol kinase [Pseudomonadota bacterium]